MGYRLRRRPRAACPMFPTGIACVSFGAEAACSLCDMIDFDHPTTCVTLGRYPAHDAQAAAEGVFWAHLARRTDGGPATPAELDTALRRRRDRIDAQIAVAARAQRIAESPLPADAPF